VRLVVVDLRLTLQATNKKYMRPGSAPPPAPPAQRRSARLAAKQAESSSGAAPTSAGGTTTADSSAVAAAVAQIETDLEKTKPDPAKKKKRGRPKKDASGPASSSSSSSSSEEEPSKEQNKDDPELVGLWSYAATKDYYAKDLPRPFRITSAKVLKCPRLWPLLWDYMVVSDADLITDRNLDGEVTKCFIETVQSFYSIHEGGNTADPTLLQRLKVKWRVFGALYFATELPSSLFIGAGEIIIKEAEAIFVNLDADHLSRLFGPKVGTHYRESSKFSSDLYADDKVHAMRQAIRKRNRQPDHYPRDGDRRVMGRCRNCRAPVPRDQFPEHNLICPKRK